MTQRIARSVSLAASSVSLSVLDGSSVRINAVGRVLFLGEYLNGNHLSLPANIIRRLMN